MFHLKLKIQIFSILGQFLLYYHQLLSQSNLSCELNYYDCSKWNYHKEKNTTVLYAAYEYSVISLKYLQVFRQYSQDYAVDGHYHIFMTFANNSSSSELHSMYLALNMRVARILLIILNIIGVPKPTKKHEEKLCSKLRNDLIQYIAKV